MKKKTFTPSTIALLTFFAASLILGWVVTAQVRVFTGRSALESLDYTQLSTLYVDINNEISGLKNQLEELRVKIDTYSSQEKNRSKIINDLKEELRSLQIINGSVSVEGPGVMIQISDEKNVLTTQDIIDLINELKASGALAIGINNVRVTEKSGFMVYDGEFYVGEKKLSEPLVIEAVGESDLLYNSLTMPGGIIGALSSMNGVKIFIEKKKELILPAKYDGR